MIEKLNGFLADLKTLRRDIRAERSKTVGKVALRKKAEETATRWLSDLCGSLETGGQVAPDKLKEYSDLFRQLLRITGPSNLKARYLALLTQIVRSFPVSSHRRRLWREKAAFPLEWAGFCRAGISDVFRGGSGVRP
jgi:hypothetical protein